MNGLTPTLTVSRPQLTDVVGWMQKFAVKGKKDLEIRRLVEQICADLAPGDYASECLSIYYWVCQNIRYMRDVYDVEFLKEPRIVLETRSGDCDDIATLLAAMLGSAGNKCSFMLVGFSKPFNPSHVFVVVDTPSGIAPLDPVANRLTPEMMGRATGSLVAPVDGGGLRDGGIGEDLTIGRPRPGTMTYSVFDYPSNCYHYYEAQALVLPASGWFRKPTGARLLQPEALAVRLPPGARRIGSGNLAKGIVASAFEGVGSLTVNTPKGSTTMSLGEVPPNESPGRGGATLGAPPTLSNIGVALAGIAGFVTARLWWRGR